MHIRVLQASDAEIYQALRLQGLQLHSESFGSTYEREAGFTVEMVQERITPRSEKFVLGAFDGEDRLVGIVTFVRATGVKETHKGNVYGMYITNDMQGRGIGKALLLELIHRAKTMDGLEQIYLTVVTSNDTAAKLYRSVGFESYGLERRALKQNGRYFDEELMVLKL